MSDMQAVVAIIDDDSIFQLTASRMMKATQMAKEILQFSNGDEGLKYLIKNADNIENLPDIILLDINMPLVDGWMFLEDYASIRNKINKDILIYMVSSSIDPNDFNRAKSMKEIQDYLIKPISKASFEALLVKFKERSIN